MFIDYSIICAINKYFCEKTGEPFGILSENAILSALSVQQSYYDTDEEIGAALFRSIILNHGFENANKRTATMCLFFYRQPYLLDKEIEKLSIDVATGKVKDVDRLVEILFYDYMYESYQRMKSIGKRLHEIDLVGFDRYCENYDLEALYESTKTKLDTSDKAKLQKFIQTTDDPEEVNVYLKGLLMEEADVDDYDLYDDFDDEDDFVDDYDATDDADNSQNIQELIKSLRTYLNELTKKANSSGDDVMRSSADMALGALDDVESYVNDII